MRDARIALGNLAIDLERYTVRVGSRRVELTYLEFETLKCLLDRRGTLVSRDQLVHALWGESPTAELVLQRRLNTHISRLRHKLAESAPWTIATVAKRGYVLSDDAGGDEE